MRNNHARDFHLVDLSNRPDVLEQITRLEQQLNQLVNGQVALIAYVNNEKKG